MRGGDNVGMIGEPQIVVGAQVQDFGGFPVFLDLNGCLLRASDQAFPFEQALRFQSLGLLSERFQKIRRHRIALRLERPQSISGRSALKAVV